MAEQMTDTAAVSIPEFKRPELEDRELITSYFEKAPSRSCERTFVNVYLWSRHYRVKYAVIGDALVFRSDENGTAFAYPAGEKENIRRAVGYLTQYCKDRGIPLVFYNVTPEMFSPAGRMVSRPVYDTRSRVIMQIMSMRQRSWRPWQGKNSTASAIISINSKRCIRTGPMNPCR